MHSAEFVDGGVSWTGNLVYEVDSISVSPWVQHREAASGRAVTITDNEPVVLAEHIERGCTIVWFAKSSSGGIDARIGAVTPNDVIEIRLDYNCVWRMSLVDSDLVIFRTAGMDTLDISVMVVKL